MIFKLRMAKPREIRSGTPIEVILGKYHHEAAPPKSRPRAAEHTASR
jgi:hypothetical protein